MTSGQTRVSCAARILRARSAGTSACLAQVANNLRYRPHTGLLSCWTVSERVTCRLVSVDMPLYIPIAPLPDVRCYAAYARSMDPKRTS